VINTEEK